MVSGADRMGDRFGLSGGGATHGLSWIAGTIAYVLILIPFAIAALNALKIEAISTPAISMLEMIMGYVPLAFTAAIILVIAYIGGKFVSDLVTNVLTGFGFDNLIGAYSGLARTVCYCSTTRSRRLGSTSSSPSL